uniref:Uncharacterized protein n=1 Tax=Anguilla anguilla TaxID=7936 RepID=A0A0E9RFR1_ANGAN
MASRVTRSQSGTITYLTYIAIMIILFNKKFKEREKEKISRGSGEPWCNLKHLLYEASSTFSMFFSSSLMPEVS